MNKYIKWIIGVFVALAISLGGVAGYKTYNNPVKSFVEHAVDTGKDVVDFPTNLKNKVINSIEEMVRSKLPKVKCTTAHERQHNPDCKWADDATKMRDSP